MAIKEPKFMQELHKIRVQMAKEWEKMSPKELKESLRFSRNWLKRRTGLLRAKGI